MRATIQIMTLELCQSYRLKKMINSRRASWSDRIQTQISMRRTIFCLSLYTLIQLKARSPPMTRKEACLGRSNLAVNLYQLEADLQNLEQVLQTPLLKEAGHIE